MLALTNKLVQNIFFDKDLLLMILNESIFLIILLIIEKHLLTEDKMTFISLSIDERSK